jgi:hypothetical protein
MRKLSSSLTGSVHLVDISFRYLKKYLARSCEMGPFPFLTRYSFFNVKLTTKKSVVVKTYTKKWVLANLLRA